MPTLLPWSSAEVGDLDIFAPAVPCLLVNTWYVDGEPESTVSYFWQDEETGIVHHELLLQAPATFDEAMEWAAGHAAGSDIERIHVRHARRAAGRPASRPRSRRAKPVSRAKGKPSALKRHVAGKRRSQRGKAR